MAEIFEGQIFGTVQKDSNCGARCLPQRRRGTRGCRVNEEELIYPSVLVYPGLIYPSAAVDYPGAAVEECLGTKYSEEIQLCTPALFYCGTRVEVVYPGAPVATNRSVEWVHIS